MKPVDQTLFGEGGNCLQASIASLLELSLDEVPYTGTRGFQEPLSVFLGERGLVYCETWRGCLHRARQSDPPAEAIDLGWQPLFNRRPLCVLCGPSPRFPGLSHATVGRTNGYGFEVLHDPHPDRTGLTDVTHIGLLVPLDVTQMVMR